MDLSGPVPNLIRRRYLATFFVIAAAILLAPVVLGMFFQSRVTAGLTHDVHGEMETITELEAVRETATTLETIARKVTNANAAVQSINDATDEQAVSIEKTLSMVEDVGSIDERTTGEAESVATNAEEQSSSISEITSSIEQFSGQTRELNDLLSGFQLGESLTTETASETTEATTTVSSTDD